MTFRGVSEHHDQKPQLPSEKLHPLNARKVAMSLILCILTSSETLLYLKIAHDLMTWARSTNEEVR